MAGKFSIVVDGERRQVAIGELLFSFEFFEDLARFDESSLYRLKRDWVNGNIVTLRKVELVRDVM